MNRSKVKPPHIKHRTKLCAGCKMNRSPFGFGRNSRSANLLKWTRNAQFRLYSRSHGTPKFWTLVNIERVTA